MSEDSQDDEVVTEDLNLDDVVGMEADDLTDTHKDFLEENREHLTDSQVTKFGMDDDSGDDDDSDDDDSDSDSDSDDDKDDDDSDDDDSDSDDIKVKSKTKTSDDDDDDDSDDDDDMDAEDKKMIRKEIARGNKKILQKQQNMEDRQAVSTIASNNPELKKYTSAALKYMKVHTSLTAEDAMSIVSSGDQQKIGAKKEREAAKKAKETQSGGGSTRPSSAGAKDWGKATNDEVEDQIARAKGQRV